ncbi:MAG: 50S ribosomal protein L25 [Acidimicrobiia bacterium]|nr:50S ribosomal protein L25 [Acidimicrobiia bacterium]
MDQVALSAAKRVASGTRPARRMRRENLVPAIVYGRDQEAVSVSVDRRELYSALHTEAGLNAIIALDVEGSSMLTVAREVQRHPVRGDITHLDFITVDLTRAIQAEVGIEYLGIPAGVREDGGVVETIEATVLIEALPTEIPSSIEVSIDHMYIGDTLTRGELPVLEGVTYVDPGDRPLLTVVTPRIEEEEPEELEEGMELEEGEEGAVDEEGTADEAGDEG